MIVVDTSAIIAVLQEEPGYHAVADKIRSAEPKCMSAASTLEVVMVLARKFADPAPVADAYYQRSAISITSIDEDQARLAQQAFLAYGKGRHPARLNMGDCFSYAAAKALNAPLLYVGNDFAQTDILAA